MKYIWTIPVMLLLASPAMGAYPKMESTLFVITSSELSGMGKYKVSQSFDTWDSLGQPSPIGQWPQGDSMGSQNSGSGWIYTFNLPVWWDKDHDRDGMPLAYEEQFAEWNGHTMWDYNPYDASQDWDGDGFTNIQEYLCRSDPTDDESFFQFTDIRLVTSEGRPLLAWWSTTTSITGFEGDFPDYPRSLGFDILYADWPVASQKNQQMPNDDWFNQTGTWQLVSGATGLPRDGEFNTYTDDDNIVGGSMSDGDIRFFRLAIGQTWNEGTPEWGAWDYYSAVGNRILCSTVARETLMIQKKSLSAGEERSLFGLAGTTTGGDGELNLILGTEYFPAGSSPSSATNFNLWISASAIATIDYLQNAAGDWRNTEGAPSSRKVTGNDGFRMIYNTDSGGGLPTDYTFYAAAQLKMDSYYHYIHKRDWNGQTISPGDPSWDSSTSNQVTFLQYNFPVDARFIGGLSSEFPTLAGTTSAQFPGWEAFESDWVLFYGRDLSGIGAGSNEDVIIYYDHGSDDRWEYFLPMTQMGNAVGTELVFSPGSPTVVMQYWNPNDPVTADFSPMSDIIPYQDGGSNPIRSYFEIGY